MIRLVTFIFLTVFATVAFAGFTGKGATGPITQVSQIKDAQDDTKCVLEGFIVEKLAKKDDDKYLFKDETGTIMVEIDEKVFKNQSVNPSIKVRLTGKVDKELIGKDEVDVKILEIIK